jgi:hypothetical protein
MQLVIPRVRNQLNVLCSVSIFLQAERLYTKDQRIIACALKQVPQTPSTNQRCIASLGQLQQAINCTTDLGMHGKMSLHGNLMGQNTSATTSWQNAQNVFFLFYERRLSVLTPQPFSTTWFEPSRDPAFNFIIVGSQKDPGSHHHGASVTLLPSSIK